MTAKKFSKSPIVPSARRFLAVNLVKQKGG
jgi:hypothetical protein